MKLKHFKHAILGGTFDHFHIGHKHFIDAALRQSQRVTIGLTTQKMTRNKFLASSIEDFETRKRALTSYLKAKRHEDRVIIIPISDIYGTALQEKNIDAIFVTEAGLENANTVNQERERINFPALRVIIIQHLSADDGGIISSTRIRMGEIDRNGRSYLKLFKQTLILPSSLRSKVRVSPAGKLIQSIHDYQKITKNNFIITVGDIVSEKLIEAGRKADVSIVDFKVNRFPLPNPSPLAGGYLIEVKNMAGTIDRNAVLALKGAIDKAHAGSRPFDSAQGKQAIRVIGEEDLLALPATMLAPLEAIVLYGMPGKGALAAKVTEENKVEVKRLLGKFEYRL